MPVSPEIRILREDDPEHDSLLAQGWEVVATSWGARLSLPDDADPAPLRRRIEEAESLGYRVLELGAQEAGEACALDAACAADYPWTPATGHQDLDPEELAVALAERGMRAFGARGPDGALVALTILEPLEDRWEVDRTCVAAAHRRRGLAVAVKAASILATFAQGARRWGTGGAAVNRGSLAANRALGFELEPLWHSLEAPPRA